VFGFPHADGTLVKVEGQKEQRMIGGFVGEKAEID
jgi:hypothetical protein